MPIFVLWVALESCVQEVVQVELWHRDIDPIVLHCPESNLFLFSITIEVRSLADSRILALYWAGSKVNTGTMASGPGRCRLIGSLE